MNEIIVIHHQILQPQRGALAYGSKLSWLKVGKAERRHVLIFERKAPELIHDVYKLYLYYLYGVAQDHQLGIAVDKAARGAEMDYGHGRLSLLAERLYVRHYVVAHFALEFFGDFVIYIVGILFHFGYLPGRNIEPELHFRLGKSYPELSPKLKALVIGKVFSHLLACVPCYQGIYINRIICHWSLQKLISQNFTGRG